MKELPDSRQRYGKEKNHIYSHFLSCSLDENDDEYFPQFNLKEIHYDRQKMFANQFRVMMTAVYGGAHAVPSVRANMGCGIFPTLFGIKQELFEDKMPWVKQHLSKRGVKGYGA